MEQNWILDANEWNSALRWLEDIKDTTEDFTPYPLQLANALRIIKNDAVFIFDEVGCGKTISAGIMAKTYVNSRKKDQPPEVLVITTNTVKLNRQFEEEWKKIDPNLNFDVYNNLATSDLKYLKSLKKWGLVVIDEAHEFNNTDTERYNSLVSSLRAEKVVFLTATPLRGGGDFDFYKTLADTILGKDSNEKSTYKDALDKLDNRDTDPQSLICAKFDPSYPVTRYFKDTVRFLDVHEKKEKAHRVIPELWVPQEKESGEETLARTIKEKWQERENSKFVIFVRLKKEAEKIKGELEKFGLKKVEVIFAENKEKLKEYGKPRTADVPLVLILNYQVGEAGINLPAYDHIIHWNISSDPARLEQRYGRIDRMNSVHDKIYSCFLVPRVFDRNFSNFINAIDFTMGELLTTLPARNVLLTEGVLRLYLDKFKENREALKEEKKMCEAGLRLCKDASPDALITINNGIAGNPDQDYQSYIEIYKSKEECFKVFHDFCDYFERYIDRIEWDGSNADMLRESMKNLLERRKRYLDKRISDNEREDIAKAFEKCINNLSGNSDKIFYLTKERDPESLVTISAQSSKDEEGCASYIEKADAYKTLREVVRLKDAIRVVKTYVVEDIAYTYELINALGKAVFSEEDWKKSKIPDALYSLTYGDTVL